MNKEIYLDNAATTPLFNEVIESMQKALKENFYNPSALYGKGIDAEKSINKVRILISETIGAKPEEIYFTSGGTEGNNTSIYGIVNASRLPYNQIKLITTKIEHPSVSEVFKDLEAKGCNVVYLSVNNKGVVDINQLENEITPNTLLVSIIGINNEIGTIQNIKELGRLIKIKNENCFFHTDYVQGFMKVPINIKECNLDALTFCSHKINGPKGIGALYLKEKIKFKPLLKGGGQELGIRSGTENLPSIIGMGSAITIHQENFQENFEKITLLRKKLIEILNRGLNDFSVNGSEKGVPGILSLSIKGIKAEVLLHALESKGILISTGSACSTHKKEKQNILKAIDLKPDYIDGTIRISFSPINTENEIEIVGPLIIEQINFIRKITKYKR